MGIEIVCKACGGNRIALAGASSDSAPVVCEDCLTPLGTLAELKETMERKVMGASRPRPDR